MFHVEQGCMNLTIRSTWNNAFVIIDVILHKLKD